MGEVVDTHVQVQAWAFKNEYNSGHQQVHWCLKARVQLSDKYKVQQ